MSRTSLVVAGLLVVAATAATVHAGGAAIVRRVEVSAPILPDMVVWQHKGGAGYPATQGDALALVTDTTYSYQFLLNHCATSYPSIVLAAAGLILTTEQLQTNYDQISRCAYDQYGAKPYWMPQILNDVDVCAVKMGAEWRLLAEADLATFTEADYKLFQDTMTLAQGADWFPRQFHFSLDVYVRGIDGQLKHGDLTPGAQHVNPLPVTDLKELYVGNGRPIGVRCVRVTMVPP